jgi:hypothetical protein
MRTPLPAVQEFTLRRRPRPAAALVVILVLTAIVAQGACLPHTHIGSGLYNAEHDLTLLAVSGTVGSLPVTGFLFVLLVTTSLVLARFAADVVVVVRDAESRAPPA